MAKQALEYRDLMRSFLLGTEHVPRESSVWKGRKISVLVYHVQFYDIPYPAFGAKLEEVTASRIHLEEFLSMFFVCIEET